MSVNFAIIVLVLWAVALVISIIGKATDNEELINFGDIAVWAAAGFGAGCALNVLVSHAEESKEPQIVSNQCVVYNGTEYCGKQHIETETRIIDVDGNGNITVKIK